MIRTPFDTLAEYERRSLAHAVAHEVGGQHGTTAAAKHQPERAEELGDEFFSKIHAALQNVVRAAV